MTRTVVKNEKVLKELGELFCSDTVEHFLIKDKDFFNIVIEAREDTRKDTKGVFRMTSVNGYQIRGLDKIIQGSHYISSIDTTWYKDKLQTEILIVEGVRE